MKFITDDELIIVKGEEDMFVIHHSSFRYIEAGGETLSFRYIEVDGETLEIPFQFLEIAVVDRRREKSTSPWKKMSKLIKGTHGWGKLLEIPEKKDRLELGYKPPNEEIHKTDQKKLCTLQETFHIAGYRGEDQVDVVEEKEKWMSNLVCHCSLTRTLSN